MLLTQGCGTRCAIGLLRNIEHKLDLTRPDDHGENTNKRYN